jgi:tripartite-type tricarboxylate transporter receptor subunit TctC
MKKIVSTLLTALVISVSATAMSFPEKPVQLIVPTGAGGGLDLITRTVAEKLDGIWKSGVVVMNKPGGAAAIASQHVMSAPADGHTILFYASTAYASAKPSTGFDYEQHFEPVSHFYSPQWVLVTNSKRNIKNLTELAELGKQKGLTYGSTVAGSPLHIYGSLAIDKMKVKGILVNYKSIPQVIVDILNNQLDFAVISYGNINQHITAGTLKPLFVFDNKKSTDFPDLPNLTSPGFSDYQNLVAGYSFFIRKDTPREVRDQVVKDLNQAIKLAMPELVQKHLVSKSGDYKLDLQNIKTMDRTFESFATKLGQ